MFQGQIIAKGTYEELLSNKVDFEKIIALPSGKHDESRYNDLGLEVSTNSITLSKDSNVKYLNATL